MSNPSFLGRHHTEETKEKIRQKRLGAKASDESRSKMSKNNARYWLGKKRAPVSDEAKRKMSIAGKGKKHKPMSEETRLKLSILRRGKKGNPNSIKAMAEANRGRKRSVEDVKKTADANRGLKRSDEVRLQMSIRMTGEKNPKYWKGKKREPQSIETRKKIGDGHRGEKSHFWKGGVTPINRAIRTSFEYKLWRESVFQRDDWTCVFCGIKSAKGIKVILHADHIKPFAYYPELRFAIDNGRTLCEPCHKTTDTFAGRAKKLNK